MVCSSGPSLISSITGKRMILLTCLIAFLAIQHGFCLYEDQIHKWDWRQRFIGIDVDNCMRSIGEEKNLIFCATGESNVIAAINRKGEIVWRNVQEAQAKLIASSLTQDNGLITVSLAKSKNESKLYMRKWSRDDYGYLIKEKIAFLVGSHDCLYSIDPSKSLISTVCSEDGGKIKSFKYLLTKEDSDAKVEEEQWSNLVNSPSNVNFEKDCLIASTNSLICLTPYSIHHLRLGDTKWVNQPLPEVLTDGKKFVLEKVSNENGFDDGFFGIKTVQAGLKSEKFHLYQVISDGLKLKASFPNVQKISILTSSESPNGRHFYGAIERADGVEIKKLGLDAKTEEVVSIKFDVTSHANGVHRLFAFKHGGNIDFVLSYDDQRLVSYNSQSQVNWQREESLSSIIWSQFISLPYFSSSPSDELWKQSDFLFLTSFINRIYSQLTAIQSYLLTSIETLFKSHSIEESHASSETEDQETSLISDKFGFHKLLFIITERGKIFVLDNVRKGKIIWTFFDPKLQQEILLEQKRVEELKLERGRTCDKLPMVSVHLQRSDLFSPLVTIVSPRGYLIAYNPLEGKLEDRVDLNIQVKQSLLMHHPNEEGVKGLVLMDDADKLFFYPNTTRDTFIAHKDSYYMFVARQTSELLQGYSFHHLKSTKETTEQDVGRRVWSLSLPPLMGSCLKMQWKEVEEHVHSQGKVLADRAVLYKYLNPNLVALVNRGEEKGDEEGGKVNVVQFYLLDTITGSIYYSVIHRRASDPVHLVHSENFVIYSFYNEKQRRIEISSLELFEGKEMPPPPPVRHPPRVVEHLSFIFPTGIRSMKETRTIRGITNKHILIALTSGGVLSLPKIFLDPRRASLSSPKYASSAAAMEEGGVYLPPYIPELPIPSEGIINYNQSIVDVNRIYVGVSSLESTCLLFITGLDIYYTRVTPSKTFDILKDDFDHYLIIIVLVALLLCSIATKYLAARKTLNAAWK